MSGGDPADPHGGPADAGESPELLARIDSLDRTMRAAEERLLELDAEARSLRLEREVLRHELAAAREAHTMLEQELERAMQEIARLVQGSPS